MSVDGRHVIVVDDDPGIQALLSSALGFAGFRVTTAGDLTQALNQIASDPPDAIVLDVMIPGGDGFDVVQLLRARSIRTPVLFLTARDAVEDRVRGLSLGGDDYVTKPFSVVEIEARLDALLRRSSDAAAPDSSVMVYQDLRLDAHRHEVTRSGDVIALSPTEFRLLEHLLRHPGHVLSRAQLLEAVWQYDFGGDSVVVERFVSNLRRKLDGGRSPLIHTIRGVGYSLRSAT